MSVYSKENPEHFKMALDSILINQTLKPDEFILVVDGPVTDELNKVIIQYETEFEAVLKVYRLEDNIGLGKALNYGMDKCTYSLIARADSDDINSSERFEMQIRKFKNDPLIDVVGSYIDEFEEDFKSPKNRKKMPLKHNEILKMAKMRNPINHMSVMFKKQVIIEAGSYEHLPYLEDYLLWIKVLNNGGKMENIDEYLVHARVGNGMLSRRSNIEYIFSSKVLNKIMKKKKMINTFEYIRNRLLIYGFIYMPLSLKSIVYKHFLRS